MLLKVQIVDLISTRRMAFLLSLEDADSALVLYRYTVLSITDNAAVSAANDSHSAELLRVIVYKSPIRINLMCRQLICCHCQVIQSM